MADVFSVSGSNPLDVLAQGDSGQRAQLAQFAILRASGFLQSSRKEDAIVAFKQALAYEPQNATALTNIGNIYLSLNKNVEAIKAFKTLVASQVYSTDLPGRADAQLQLANAYLQDKQYSESEKAYKEAARLNPSNPLPDYSLGLQYLNTDRLQEAEAQFLKVKAKSPRDGNVYYGLGSLYNKQGKFADAVESLQTAIQLKPNFPAARYELGVALSKLGRNDEAAEQLKSLTNDKSSYASDLSFELSKPRITSIAVDPGSQFNLALGANSQLWSFDAGFLTPNASKVISINIQFDQKLDINSVSNIANWSISRAKGGVAGYYNNTLPVSSSEVSLPANPLSVSYNPLTGVATVNFQLNQNATGDATIDPGHIVFKFSGKDSSGRSMDSSADEIDGYSQNPF